MKFAEPLIEGRFLKRYKRFFADAEINGETVTAHVANTGSLKGVAKEGLRCLCSPSSDPKRKLKFSLEAIEASEELASKIDSKVTSTETSTETPTETSTKTPKEALKRKAVARETHWVGVNTSHPNKLIHEALLEKRLPHWQNFSKIKPEHAITKETRFDFAAIVGDTGRSSVKPFNYFIEVKNVSLVENGVAKFPDSVTERGQKHLRELMRLQGEGNECEIVYVIQRTDCNSFAAAEDIDPEYASLLQKAKKKGVRITPLIFEVKPEGIHFVRELAYL